MFAGVLSGAVTVSAQETDGPYPKEDDPPESFTGLLSDKAEIAEQQYGRLRGLREADNPHIPEGLLLRQIQVDPEKSQVDMESLRRAQLARFESREFTPQVPTDYFSPGTGAAPKPQAGSQAGAEDEVETTRSPSFLVWLFVAVSVAGTVVLLLQSRRR